jgi:hypothetical protein
VELKKEIKVASVILVCLFYTSFVFLVSFCSWLNMCRCGEITTTNYTGGVSKQISFIKVQLWRKRQLTHILCWRRNHISGKKDSLRKGGHHSAVSACGPRQLGLGGSLFPWLFGLVAFKRVGAQDEAQGGRGGWAGHIEWMGLGMSAGREGNNNPIYNNNA